MFKKVQRLIFGAPTISSITKPLKQMFADPDAHQRELDAEAERLTQVAKDALAQRDVAGAQAQQARKIAINLSALLAD